MIMIFHKNQNLPSSSFTQCSVPQVVSCSTHWSKGNVDRDLAGFAVLGALLGGFGGGEMAALLPERALRLIFATWQGEDLDESLCSYPLVNKHRP